MVHRSLRQCHLHATASSHLKVPSHSTIVRAVLVAVVVCGLLGVACDATIMSVDMGLDFMKLAAPRDTTIDVCLNEQSLRKSDTWIGFRGDERFFGSDAKNFAARFPDNMLPAVPRLAGIGYNATDVTKRWLRDAMHYTFGIESNAGRGTVNITVPPPAQQPLDGPPIGAMSFSTEELLGMLMQYAKQQVVRDIRGPIRDAIVVVPKGFDSRQRQAVVDAAAVAGVRVLSLMHPTTAAALQLGIQNRGFDRATTVLIYDMGAGKTEAGVYRFEPPTIGAKVSESLGTIRLLGSIASDMDLGGRTVDACIAELLEDEYVRSTKAQRVLSGTSQADRKATASLMRAANKAKEILSANREAPVTVEGIAPERDFSTKLSRSMFEDKCRGLWDRAVALRNDALRSANVSLDALDRFEVVGGGLRVPIVIDRLSEGYPKGTVDRTLNSDEAMVVGAGYYGAALSGHFRLKGFRLLESLGHPIYVQVSRREPTDTVAGNEQQPSPSDALGERKVLFSAATRLPARMRLRFNRTDDFTVVLVEERRHLSAESTSAAGGDHQRPAPPPQVLSSATHILGAHEALSQIGFYDVDAASRNITFGVFVDVRATEGGMVFVERAELIADYTVNASRKVRVLKNETLSDANNESEAAAAGSGDGPAEDASTNNDNDDVSVSDEDDAAPQKTPSTDREGTTSTDKGDAQPTTATNQKATSPKKREYVTITEVRPEPRRRVFPLALSTTFSFPPPMNKTESLLSRNVLRFLSARDAMHLKRSMARNDLEAYMVWARGDGFVGNAATYKVASEADINAANEKLEALQSWIDDHADDATTDDLNEKLRAAKTIVRVALREPATAPNDGGKSAAAQGAGGSVGTSQGSDAAASSNNNEDDDDGDDDAEHSDEL